MINDDAHLRLSTAEALQIFDTQIRASLTGESRQSPVLTVIAGPPGSGKSSSEPFVVRDLGRADAVLIDGDTYRARHPMYLQLQQENDFTADRRLDAQMGGVWTRMALDHARANRFDIIFSTPLGNPDHAEAMIESYRSEAYGIEVVFLATDEDRCQLSIADRYARGRNPSLGKYGRWVETSYLNQVYSGLLETADRIQGKSIADALYVARRGEGIIHANHRVRDGAWEQTSTRAAIEVERARVWAKREADDVRQRIEFLRSQRDHLPTEARPDIDDAIHRAAAHLRQMGENSPPGSSHTFKGLIGLAPVAQGEIIRPGPRSSAEINPRIRREEGLSRYGEQIASDLGKGL